METATTAGVMLRWLRAATVAVLALLTGVIAHVAAGGDAPDPWALVLLTMPVAVLCAPLLRAEASMMRLVLLLVAGQAFIHGILTLATGTHGSSAGTGHAHGALQPAPSTVQMGSSPVAGDHLSHDLSAFGFTMVVAHLAAAVLIGWWLAAGERTVWNLLTLAARPVAAAVWQVLVEAFGVRPAPVESALALRTPGGRGEDQLRRLERWLLCRAVTRRGPPAWCAV